MTRGAKSVGKRRMAREMTVQMLYQLDLGGSTVRDVVAAFDPVEYLQLRAEGETRKESSPGLLEEARLAFEQACEMLASCNERIDELDGKIRSQAEHWRLERMPAVDRNILRLAVWELLHAGDVPPLVVVDEAVELAKRFGSDQSGRFVNGLLDGVLRTLAPVGEQR